MASNRHAPVDSLDVHPLERTPQDGYGAYASSYGSHPTYYGPKAVEDEPVTEWNPSEDSLRPVRGRHRVSRQRGGTIARSRAVLGVGVIAAVGAGGMATANDEGAGSVPGMSGAANTVANIPVLSALVGSSDSEAAATTAVFTTAGLTDTEVEAGTDAGEALRARILQQADQQETSAETDARTTAVEDARSAAVEEAAILAEAERVAEEERQRAEEEERQRAEEERRLAELRASYTLPLSTYRLTSSFGDSGSMWQSNHTGTDFAAATGTPVKNVHTGVVKEAAWAGSYGYRIIVEQEDGTELWYCHLSSMNVSTGTEVTTGDVIGQVGSTGNSSGPHLHLEVRPGGGDAIDPLAWLRDKGQSI
ncbi:M23 family metallopeptidase [Streptomyces sp. DSM 44915]|uniref:M23 family metallopeptidase n=1 Tax=Streptomyces chisholmiae TaxID=3075540 RepID=A0ABU2JZA7_9ACTN|nr:M23 family metallopeptidase [Streptomyces sp. DSM 44915]MDT0270327.1 M23 family metallopeptidase [Streptomyces sp. DSM 44915]